MRFTRRYTSASKSPYTGLAFKRVDIDISHTDCLRRYCMSDIQVPAGWSYQAAETLATHYMRKAGVARMLKSVEEENVPDWLQPQIPDDDALLQLPEKERYGSEVSAIQLFHRLAGSFTYWGWKIGYFDTEEDARTFYDELCYMFATQKLAPHTPQWLNTGLHWAYGIKGAAQGHYYIDPFSERLKKSTNTYEYPQHHSVFLQAVRDSLVSDGGILNLWERESRVFKYGASTGSNFSVIRSEGEKLSSGERSMGVLRFLAAGDKAASAIKSVDRKQRDKKIVVLDIDHPDVCALVRWRVEEEQKAAAMVAGSYMLRQHLMAIMLATSHGSDKSRFLPSDNPKLKKALYAARAAMVPEHYIQRVIDYARQGLTEILIPVYGTDAESDVFYSVSAHQMQIAVRLDDDFMDAVVNNKQWALQARCDNDAIRTISATDIFEEISQAEWACGAPAIQFNDVIAKWHTCPEEGDIRSTSVDGDTFFLDDTASIQAILNVAAFTDENNDYDFDALEHATRIATVMLDIGVAIAQYPSQKLAMQTYSYRPLGLGHCNLASALMAQGIAYDSAKGRAYSAALNAIITGAAYKCSAEIAREIGAFKRFSDHKKSMMQVIEKHRELAQTERDYDSQVSPALELRLLETSLIKRIHKVWDMAALWGDEYGFRNAQVTAIPPVELIAKLLDAETIAVAPHRYLVRHAPQGDGSSRKYLIRSVEHGLRKCGYSDKAIDEIKLHALGRATLVGCPYINHESLKAKGFSKDQIDIIEDTLSRVTHISEAFDPFIIGEGFCRSKLRLSDDDIFNASFSILKALKYSDDEIEEAHHYCCGTGEIELSPLLHESHTTIFRTKLSGERAISPDAQIKLIAAIQPFVSGGVAHTIRVSKDTSISACSGLIRRAWSSGVKSLAIVRENASLVNSPLLGLEDTSQNIEEELDGEPRVKLRDVSRDVPYEEDDSGEEEIVLQEDIYADEAESISMIESDSPIAFREIPRDEKTVYARREAFSDIESCLAEINRLTAHEDELD